MLSQYRHLVAVVVGNEHWTHPTVFFLSYPIHCLQSCRGGFDYFLHHKPGDHPAPFLHSCLCGVALEPFYHGIFRYLFVSCHSFKFHLDKFPPWISRRRLLHTGACGGLYSGTFYYELFQSRRRLPGNHIWSLQEHYGPGSDLQGLRTAYAWEELTNIFQGTITWQPSVLSVGLFFFFLSPQTHMENLCIDYIFQLLIY